MHTYYKSRGEGSRDTTTLPRTGFPHDREGNISVGIYFEQLFCRSDLQKKQMVAFTLQVLLTILNPRSKLHHSRKTCSPPSPPWYVVTHIATSEPFVASAPQVNP
ncbi:unnamed protein product, partial [Pylaiella littoralis]